MNHLSYESQKVILQRMEANKRFQISKCIPSIQNVERLVPLKIEYLAFAPTELYINETVYQFRIRREYHDENSLRFPEFENENIEGGVSHDIDPYGFRDRSNDNIVMPGDIVIGVLRQDEGRFDRIDEAHMHELEDQLKDLEEQNAQQPCEMMEMIMDATRTKLLPFYARRNRTHPPYNTFLQLSINSPGRNEVHRCEYTSSIHVAMKNLISSLLGNRQKMIQVKHLEFKHNNMIARLSLDLKMQIRELCVSTNMELMIKALQPVVDESSFPLDVVTVVVTPGHRLDYNHRILMEARELHVRNTLPSLSVLDDLRGLQHRNIHFTNGKNFRAGKYFDLIQNWIDSQSPIGLSVSFGKHQEEYISEIMQAIKNRFENAKTGTRSLYVPMNDHSEIKVECIKVDKHTNLDDFDPFTFKFEVCTLEF